MFHKELLLGVQSSTLSWWTHSLTIGKLNKSDKSGSYGYYSAGGVGALTPPTLNGLPITHLLSTYSYYGNYPVYGISIVTNVIPDYPVYFGFYKSRKLTVKVEPYPNATAWDYTSQASKSLKTLYTIFSEESENLTVQIYLSSTPPPWGYTE